MLDKALQLQQCEGHKYNALNFSELVLGIIYYIWWRHY